MASVETGVFTSTMLPMSYRTYFEAVLLDVLRAQTIYQGYATPVVDFAARDTKLITFTEVHDLHPAIGALSEAVPFVEGAYLDGKQYTMTVSERGNVVKTNKFHNITQFWNSGEFESLVREKLGALLPPGRLARAPDLIRELVRHPEQFRQHVASLRNSWIHNLGRSAEAGAEAVAGIAAEIAAGAEIPAPGR